MAATYGCVYWYGVGMVRWCVVLGVREVGWLWLVALVRFRRWMCFLDRCSGVWMGVARGVVAILGVAPLSCSLFRRLVLWGSWG